LVTYSREIKKENSMAKVSVHIGFTFRVGPLDQNQYGRVDLNIDQIDTELPLDKQLEESKAIADTVFEVAKTKVDAQIDDMLID
tara:strand:+ start:270 stop:521 length:252 start_codon:yes stop_codon:yes gene_type:complete